MGAVVIDGMIHGVDIIVVGYHQPDDSRGFHDALLDCYADTTPWEAMYVSVEATPDDVDLGNEIWGGNRHLICFENVGHATACNLAAQSGYHDTLFFCNADTRLAPGVIDRCFETLWSDHYYGCVGPRQVDESGRITAGGIFGTQEHPLHRGWHQRTEDYKDFRDDAVTTSGALYMIKRHVWDELATCPLYVSTEKELTGNPPKGAMPAVAHYFSETWPSYHLATHGYNNVYEGRVTARHDWHKASPQGGYGEQNWSKDQAHFRALCDAHGIPHD